MYQNVVRIYVRFFFFNLQEKTHLDMIVSAMRTHKVIQIHMRVHIAMCMYVCLYICIYRKETCDCVVCARVRISQTTAHQHQAILDDEKKQQQPAHHQSK